MPEMHPVDVRMPDDLIDCLDDVVEAGHYTNRSEAVRKAVHDFVAAAEADA